jgi:hypothetical protein
VRQCRSHPYHEGLLAVPDLGLGRNIPPRRMKGKRSGLRPRRPPRSCLAINCWKVSS